MERTPGISCNLGGSGYNLYGKVVEPFELSWDLFDISSGSRLVLHSSGRKIDEEIKLVYNSITYPIWVKEVEHSWPLDLKEPSIPVMVGENGGEDAGMLDLEEGEIQPVVTQNREATTILVAGHPENQREAEMTRPIGEVGTNTLHGERWAAHVGVDFLCTLRKSRAADVEVNGGSDHLGSATQMDLHSLVSSRKRPSNFRSPCSLNSPSGPNQNEIFGKKADIPPFPDLNNHVIVYIGSPADTHSLGFVHPDEIWKWIAAPSSQRIRWGMTWRLLNKWWQTQMRSAPTSVSRLNLLWIK
ncbi:hypothetical protein L1987_29964 [Smallanthus sonchifolius]|uniref:Uncharacterized protein n=1 Tax=Smallanthus sonchifolius TaxID=185202 RepID=A0ACB9I1C0_9ASTR|nr:hypothetical protein L1987_29964 [Smallanthus sonchifolius]